ncbi:ABC-2 transporter permease [Rossellomorea sp. FS2]|uniref:ABC-2 transporter permease n=1 Tax=Rossellomorea sp. FS2 TaxID=3391447 RepID=UPI003A4D9E64
MLQLIRKDFMLHRNILVILLGVLIIYLVLGAPPIWVGLVFILVLSMSTFGNDEKTTINLFLNSLPFTRKEIVSSKYISVLIYTVAITILLFLGSLLIHGRIMEWQGIVFMTMLSLLSLSFMLPFAYRFASKYLMIASLVLFAAYFAVVNVFIPNLNDIIRESVGTLVSLESTAPYLIVCVAVLAIFALSWVLSIRIYEKKVF